MFTKTSFVLTGLPSALWIWTDPKRDWRLLSLRGVLFLHPPYPAKFKTSPSLPSITEPQSWKLRRSSISGLLHCMSQTTELSKTLRSADNISSQGLIFFFFFLSGFQLPRLSWNRLSDFWRATCEKWKHKGSIWGLPAVGDGWASLNGLCIGGKVSGIPLLLLSM